MEFFPTGVTACEPIALINKNSMTSIFLGILEIV